ncbi:hypothetical protein KF840_13430 [bacterium]|nr:hypothetical protein [bacterium]
MGQAREKFASQIDSSLLRDVRRLAKAEGRQIQALLEEALHDLLDKRRQESPRRRIMDLYAASHDRYADLYRKLAK